MSDKQKSYDVLKVDEYTTDNGEVKPRFYRIGVAFDNQDGDGQTLIIPEGISISGRIVTKARKERDADAG